MMCCFDCGESDHCMALSFVMVRDLCQWALFRKSIVCCEPQKQKVVGVPKGPDVYSTNSQDLREVGAHISQQWSQKTFHPQLSLSLSVMVKISCKAKLSNTKWHKSWICVDFKTPGFIRCCGLKRFC